MMAAKLSHLKFGAESRPTALTLGPKPGPLVLHSASVIQDKSAATF